eukprot:11175990-Lingulodinium_polyedra.AAC.1
MASCGGHAHINSTEMPWPKERVLRGVSRCSQETSFWQQARFSFNLEHGTLSFSDSATIDTVLKNYSVCAEARG